MKTQNIPDNLPFLLLSNRHVFMKRIIILNVDSPSISVDHNIINIIYLANTLLPYFWFP